MAKIVYWEGSPVKVLKEYEDSPGGDKMYTIEVSFPGSKVVPPYHINVKRTDTSPCISPTPLLEPWMLTILQRLAVEEKHRCIFTPAVQRQIKTCKSQYGDKAAKLLEKQIVEGMTEDAKNKFTDVGKMQNIIKRLDDIAEAYLNEM